MSQQSPSQHALPELTRRVLEHRDERQWGQFHTPKELAISLCVESAELLSLMQWKTPEQVGQVVSAKRAEVQDELADVLHSVLLLASDLKIDLGEALVQKLQKDAAKYPVAKARGRNSKYDEL
jgi:NTP pyrophosphatase (non-canonical NTP hydrolase)